MIGGSLLDAISPRAAPAPPATARKITTDELEEWICPQCGGPIKNQFSRSCPACQESKKARRKPSKSDQPQQPQQEVHMPRGVYERKPKAAAPGGEKPKRKYTRRAKAAETTDPKALALEAFTDSANNLARTVRDTVDMDDAPELTAALRTFDICSKIHAVLK